MSSINDPAWFYSTLAQSSAAIVGLIGAILISRVLEHLTIRKSEKEEIMSLLNGMTSSFSQKINWRNRFKTNLENNIKFLEEGFRNGNSELAINDIDWYGAEHRIQVKVDQGGSLIKGKLKELNKVNETYEKITFDGDFADDKVRVYIGMLDKLENDDELRKICKDPIKNDKKALENIIKSINEFKKRLLPTEFKGMFCILFFISIFGIIYPLFYLPGIENSCSKNLCMICLILGIFSLNLFYLYQFYQIRKLGIFRLNS